MARRYWREKGLKFGLVCQKTPFKKRSNRGHDFLKANEVLGEKKRNFAEKTGGETLRFLEKSRSNGAPNPLDLAGATPGKLSGFSARVIG
jgi:hypothetical protein